MAKQKRIMDAVVTGAGAVTLFDRWFSPIRLISMKTTPRRIGHSRLSRSYRGA
jgi:hypothetical protein